MPSTKSASRLPTWQLLIPTMPHRHDKLLELLGVLEPQVRPGFEVIVWRDNLQASFGQKCQGLLEASSAEYVSHINDDDLVTPDFVAKIDKALRTRPDYVGFKVLYTEDGTVMAPTVHSLEYGGWVNTPQLIYRDITHVNPIRRELAIQASFRGHDITDREYADDLRALGCIKTQAFIDEEIYLYRHSMNDFILTGRQPMAEEDIPPLPKFPFVRYL